MLPSHHQPPPHPDQVVAPIRLSTRPLPPFSAAVCAHSEPSRQSQMYTWPPSPRTSSGAHLRRSRRLGRLSVTTSASSQQVDSCESG
ncbi:hypothetical protein BCR44DRAFT_1433749 [Catenaria anguillulae PL171]|uniref:Uncharacterized protein n=1 Tax=Catenaria anguillulae PL171 TaxID=765915 RepID=A0A1Y2HQE5_9FUNG|nr:hypothetical protein BCR44DRAFT_1433749 [Catenaria anguillulae PL171]